MHFLESLVPQEGHTLDSAAGDHDSHDSIVFRHVPVVMVPLDVTHRFIATESVRKRFVAPLLRGLLAFFSASYKETFYMDGPPVHDVCAAAAVVRPDLFTFEAVHVSVEKSNPLLRGMTIVDPDTPAIRPFRRGIHFPLWKNVLIARSVDSDALWDELVSTLAPVNKADYI